MKIRSKCKKMIILNHFGPILKRFRTQNELRKTQNPALYLVSILTTAFPSPSKLPMQAKIPIFSIPTSMVKLNSISKKRVPPRVIHVEV